MADNVGSIKFDASIDTQGIRNDAKKIEGDLNNIGERGNSAFGGLGKVAKVSFAAAAAAAAAGVALIGSHIDDAVKRVDTLNRFPTVMENMGYSANDAETQVKRMADSLRGLPTSLDAITTFVSRVAPMSGGVKKATDVALAFNNAVLAGGGPIYRQADAIEQFSQMLGKGVPDMMAWRTLQEAMPATLSQVAKSMGIASGDTTQLYEAIQSGKFSMQDFSDEIIKLNNKGLPGYKNFTEQAKDATQGIQTGWENFKISITRGVADIIQSIGSANISNAISNIGAGFENGLKGFGQFIKDIQPGIKMFNDALGWMWQQFKPIFDSISANKPLLEFLGTFFKALAVIVGVVLVAAFGLALAAVVFVIGIFEALRNVGLFLGDTIYNVATFFVDAWNTIVKAWSNAAGWFNGAVGGIRGAFSSIPGTIAGVFSSAWRAVTSIWGGIGSWFSGLGGQMLGAGRNIIDGLVKGISGGKDAVVNKIKEIASNSLQAIKDFFGIKSPSRVMAQMGTYMMQGWSIGMDKSSSMAISSAQRASSGVLGTFDNLTSPTLGIDGTGSLSGSYGSRTANITNNYVVNNQADAEIISKQQAYAMGAV